jgi:hypothetical protein
MTRYTVIWDEDVEGPFIEAWLAGDSRIRAILTEAANWVDANLGEDPDRKGQPVSDQSARGCRGARDRGIGAHFGNVSVLPRRATGPSGLPDPSRVLSGTDDLAAARTLHAKAIGS